MFVAPLLFLAVGINSQLRKDVNTIISNTALLQYRKFFNVSFDSRKKCYRGRINRALLSNFYRTVLP